MRRISQQQAQRGYAGTVESRCEAEPASTPSAEASAGASGARGTVGNTPPRGSGSSDAGGSDGETDRGSGDSGGGSPNGGSGSDNDDYDPMSPEEAALIADHSVAQGREIPGIESSDELAAYIFNVVNSVEEGKRVGRFPEKFEGPRKATRNRKAYWDREREVLIIRHPPGRWSDGTMFVPTRGYDYFLQEFPEG